MAEADLPRSFLAALRAAVDWFEGEQVPYVAIGGVAVSLLAQPRATQDIDVVIWLAEDRWEAFLQAGARYGFAPRLSDALEFAQVSRMLLLSHLASGISLDVSCGALEFEREMIERASAFPIGELRLRIPTPEDLIITKAVVQRAKDLADMEALITVHQDLDVERIRRWVKEFATALEMPELSANMERLLRGRAQREG